MLKCTSSVTAESFYCHQISHKNKNLLWNRFGLGSSSVGVPVVDFIVIRQSFNSRSGIWLAQCKKKKEKKKSEFNNGYINKWIKISYAEYFGTLTVNVVDLGYNVYMCILSYLSLRKCGGN